MRPELSVALLIGLAAPAASCADDALPGANGTPNGNNGGSPPIEVGSAETPVTLSAEGCASAGLTLETEMGVRLEIDPDGCLVTRDGQRPSGEWTVGLESSDLGANFDEPGVELVAAVRVVARAPDGAEAALTGPFRLIVDLRAWRSSGAWFRYAFAGDPFGEVASDRNAAGRPLLGSAIPVPRDTPAEIELDGTGTVGLGWLALASSSRGLQPKQGIPTATVTQIADVDPVVDIEPDLCLWRLINHDTAEIVFVSNAFEHLEEGGSVAYENPHGRFVTRLIGSVPRQIEIDSAFANLFALRYALCDGSAADFEPAEGVVLGMRGASEGEADVDARYVGKVEATLIGTSAGGIDEAIDALEELNDALPSGSTARMLWFRTEDETPVSTIEISGYARSTRRLVERLPEEWRATPGNRTLEVRLPSSQSGPVLEVMFPSRVVAGVPTTLEVLVVNGGEPVDSALVTAELQGARQATVTGRTDAEGRAALSVLPAPGVDRVVATVTVEDSNGVDFGEATATASIEPPNIQAIHQRAMSVALASVTTGGTNERERDEDRAEGLDFGPIDFEHSAAAENSSMFGSGSASVRTSFRARATAHPETGELQRIELNIQNDGTATLNATDGLARGSGSGSYELEVEVDTAVTMHYELAFTGTTDASRYRLAVTRLSPFEIVENELRSGPEPFNYTGSVRLEGEGTVMIDVSAESKPAINGTNGMGTGSAQTAGTVTIRFEE